MLLWLEKLSKEAKVYNIWGLVIKLGNLWPKKLIPLLALLGAILGWLRAGRLLLCPLVMPIMGSFLEPRLFPRHQHIYMSWIPTKQLRGQEFILFGPHSMISYSMEPKFGAKLLVGLLDKLGKFRKNRHNGVILPFGIILDQILSIGFDLFFLVFNYFLKFFISDQVF